MVRVNRSEALVSFPDVVMARLVQQAYSLSCGIAQDIETRQILLFPHPATVLSFPDVAAARSWLRLYVNCGVSGRRCFVDGVHRCALSANLPPVVWPKKVSSDE